MQNQSYSGAANAAPGGGESSDNSAVRFAAKAAVAFTTLGVLDALFAYALFGVGLAQVVFKAFLFGIPAAVLLFKPSRIALGVLIASSVLGVLLMAFLYMQGGGVLTAIMMMANGAFAVIFIRGFMAARRLSKNEAS